MATGDADDADDVAQETLLRVYRHLPRYRGDARFTTWLYRIVVSAAADLARRRNGRTRKLLRLFREGGQPQPPPPDAGIEGVQRERLVQLVRAFLTDLPPGQRRVFDLADLQGFAPAEIADMLDMNPSTVRAHLFRARRTIRRRMLDAGAAEETP